MLDQVEKGQGLFTLNYMGEKLIFTRKETPLMLYNSDYLEKIEDLIK